MNPRVLGNAITAYRIGDPDGQFPVWSAEGARRVAARWHEIGAAVIYASEHYATALLEKLVYCNGNLPPNEHFVEVDIPAGVSYEVVTKDSLPGWFDPSCLTARAFGREWYDQFRTAVLFVPSVVARMEQNIIVNTLHPDFRRKRIDVGLEQPVWWDRRLFLGPFTDC